MATNRNVSASKAVTMGLTAGVRFLKVWGTSSPPLPDLLRDH